MSRLIFITLMFSFYAVIANAEDDRYREFDNTHLQHGKTVWLTNCEGCHGWGIADSPIPMKYAEWKSRIEKGRYVLYEHAINGFFGPDDAMMPERGGNPKLTDEEVKAAVDYMIELALSYKDEEIQ